MNELRLPLWGAVLLGALWSLPAHAQGAPADVPATESSARATELFEQGKKLFAEGKFRESRAAYLEAYELRQSYDVAANLGNVEIKLGRWAAAAQHLTFALDNLPPTLDSATRQAAQSKIRERLQQAAEHVGTLALTVQPAGTEVLIDGTPVGNAPIDAQVFLEPGRHVIEAQLAGHASKTEAVQMTAGKELAVTLSLSPKSSAGDGGAGSEGGGPNLPLVIAGGGVAVAALGAGVAMMVLSSSRGSDRQTLVDGLASSSECAPGGTIHPSCGEIQSLADDERLFQGLGIGMLIGGGVIAAGTLTYALWPQDGGADSARLQIVPLVSPFGGGAMVTGSF